MNVPSPQTAEQVSQVARIITQLMTARMLENKENADDHAQLSSTTPTPTSSSDDEDNEDDDFEDAANATPQDARVSSDKSQEMSPKKAIEIATKEVQISPTLDSNMPIKSDEDGKTNSKLNGGKPVRAPLVVHDNEPGIRSPTATPVGKRPHRRSEF